jgi:hypothetical protein
MMLNDAQLDQLEPAAKEAFRWMAQGTDAKEAALVSIAISLRRIADSIIATPQESAS